MAYTGTEIFDRAIVVLDELSDTGVVLDAQVKEYKYRAPSLLDLWQQQNTDLRATHDILRKPPVNLLGTRYDVKEHGADDETFAATAAAGVATSTAGAAVFTVDNQSEVYIENRVAGAWANAAGYYAQDGGDETAFDGLITVAELTAPSTFKCRMTAAGTQTRLRFSGDYQYLFSNFALFDIALPTCARVPEYGEYVKYALPDNFDRVEQILTESPAAGLSHKWENGSDLMVNYDYEGTIKITYRPNPTKITALTQTLEISEGAAAAGVYYLAMYFAMSDQNEDLASLCRSEYQRISSKMTVKKPLKAQPIRDVYGISSIR